MSTDTWSVWSREYWSGESSVLLTESLMAVSLDVETAAQTAVPTVVSWAEKRVSKRACLKAAMSADEKGERKVGWRVHATAVSMAGCWA